jgi:hypothetical protein
MPLATHLPMRRPQCVLAIVATACGVPSPADSPAPGAAGDPVPATPARPAGSLAEGEVALDLSSAGEPLAIAIAAAAGDPIDVVVRADAGAVAAWLLDDAGVVVGRASAAPRAQIRVPTAPKGCIYNLIVAAPAGGPARYTVERMASRALSGCRAPSNMVVDTTIEEASWEPFSRQLGNPPNFAQLGNGSTMSVVSRGWGRGARAGALVELYYPRYGADNLWDAYVGVRSRGAPLRWAHDLRLIAQRLVPDTGRVVTELDAPGLALTLEDVLRPANDAHVRRVTVENTGAATLEDVELAFYAFFTLGTLPDGDRLRFEAPRGALVQVDEAAGIAAAALADRSPAIAHCGYALNDLELHRDARLAAEAGDLARCPGLAPSITGVNGVLVHRLGPLAPGARAQVTYAIGLAPDAAGALAEAGAALDGGFDARAEEDRAHWARALARAPLPRHLPADAREVYRRAVITILQHRVENGAFIAAPTLMSPVYKLVWPRDGSKTAVDLLGAGFAGEARAFFEHLETLQKDDGSFAINYNPDGSGPFLDLGPDLNENDQPGMFPWGVARVLEATGDGAWARARWPAVRRAAEHLLAITASGLVAPSRDLWELESGGSWTYSTAAALAGLEAAAIVARLAGADGDAARYAERARAARAAILERLVTPDGFLARGLTAGRLDTRLEIANLALGRGGFGVLPDDDPRLARLGDLLAARLATPGGALRRYEGDRYYGGRPWPVASAWLALHRLARGDRAGAEALFQVMTCQALATDTLMLGEQFDEERKAWLSAKPLVWSEAAYLRTARALYGD